jgi:anion-transporting  ArsA/GET3 family ATPase
VLDAPPTGRIARFLNVNAEVAGLARMGPIRKQADSVMRLLRSQRTAIHLVTLLEEMPVQETIDGVAELTGLGLPVGAVIVNLVREPLLAPADLALAAARSLDSAELGRGLKAAGIEASEELLAALGGEAADHADRVALEARERERLAGLGRPMVELPVLPDAAQLSGLHELARRLLVARNA